MKCGGTKRLFRGNENVVIESKWARVACRVVKYCAEVRYDT